MSVANSRADANTACWSGYSWGEGSAVRQAWQMRRETVEEEAERLCVRYRGEETIQTVGRVGEDPDVLKAGWKQDGKGTVVGKEGTGSGGARVVDGGAESKHLGP
mmetsp:Transcript_29996/g.84640  ORF Transcript_29996/g.84640 Transcript_29996/m.84640 type:complete len:105 (-) Transcript_29996:719-1033(-)